LVEVSQGRERKRYNVHDYYVLSEYERRRQIGRQIEARELLNEQLVEQLLEMTSEQRRRWMAARWLEFLRTGI
jgi:hypothetical protein